MEAPWTSAQMPSLAGKTALVTGANSGLGLETTLGLCAAGATVLMACRDPQRSAAAADRVRSQVPGARLQLIALDLADLDSVRRCAATVLESTRRLDILCNNAGVMALPLQRTRQGFEMQIGTNHLGHFVLTGLLLERLAQGDGGRVVTVASLAHRWTRGLNLEDLNFERSPYNRWDAYGKSKLANLLFHFELQRRLTKTGLRIDVAAAHPGYSATNLAFPGPRADGSSLKLRIMELGNTLFAQSAAMGALPSLYACGMPDVESGDYYGPTGFQQIRGYPGKVGCRRLARDPEAAAGLWALSEKLTGLRYP